MAGAKFTFEGLPELRAQLRKLPAELTVEAGREVEAAANGAMATIQAFYGQHVLTGRLLRGLKLTHQRSQFGAVSVIRSTSPLAWLVDNGSKARHYITRLGKVHGTGKMWGAKGSTPPTHIFARTASKARRRMNEQHKAMLERHGARVTGDA